MTAKVAWLDNQTPVSHRQWRDAEDRASKSRMECDALRDSISAMNRSALTFAIACGIFTGKTVAPSSDDIQKLQNSFGCPAKV